VSDLDRMHKRAGLSRFFPVRPNYRERPVGVWLGVAFVLTLMLCTAFISVGGLLSTRHLVGWRQRLVWIVVGVAMVSAAGLYDDFRPKRTRGIARQVAMLRTGQVSSGVVKLLVISSASALVAWMLGARGVRWAVGTAVIAGAADLWNLLDVLPGRALKYFLPAVAGFALVAPPDEYYTLSVMAFGGAAALLVLDLREIGMLGDAGSNVLGFIVGVGALEAFSRGWLVLTLAVILALHALAETVTLSRIIEVTPPLRWFDRLGRVKQADEQPKQDRGEHSSSS
jgi:hypothetical protein